MTLPKARFALSVLPLVLAAVPTDASPPTLTADLDAVLGRIMALELAPGMAVAVVHNDDVVYLRGFGFADVETRRRVTPDTVFYIASATKPFTGTAVAILDKQEKLDLDGSLGSYLRRATYHEDIDPESITLRQLLNHTHGIINSGPVTFRVAFSGEHDPELLCELLRHHGSCDRQFKYGNIGYNVASMAMDESL